MSNKTCEKSNIGSYMKTYIFTDHKIPDYIFNLAGFVNIS